MFRFDPDSQLLSAEAALTKISVVFRFCFDDVGIGARAVAVVSK